MDDATKTDVATPQLYASRLSDTTWEAVGVNEGDYLCKRFFMGPRAREEAEACAAETRRKLTALWTGPG